jgi:uncharacterized membrane protein
MEDAARFAVALHHSFAIRWGRQIMFFTGMGGVLLAIVILAVSFRQNRARIIAISFLTVFLLIGMMFGYTVARHHTVDSFDHVGEVNGRQMMAGIDA